LPIPHKQGLKVCLFSSITLIKIFAANYIFAEKPSLRWHKATYVFYYSNMNITKKEKRKAMICPIVKDIPNIAGFVERFHS
jgi:hypothetical protein